ncbi:MAG: hypothetical protein AB7V50_06075 [Vampirovibrionia bacterium]
MKLGNFNLKNETHNLMNRLNTQNRGIQSTDNQDGTRSYQVGGKGALMEAFFASQLDKGGSRNPFDPASSYSMGVLEKQYETLSNVYENNTNLTASQKEAISLQMQLNQAIQSANTNNDGKVTVGEWLNYIQENADSSGKLNFIC